MPQGGPVIVINPNSTAAMTATMTDAARAAAPDLRFEGWTSYRGPPAIQGPEDGEAASPPLLDLVADAARTGAAGIVIGCFDDTALDAAAQAAPCPVIGIGQAAFHACAMRGWRFSVVTTLAVSIPVIDANIRRYGLGGGLGRVRASDVPVLDLEKRPDAAAAAILTEVRAAIAEDGADAVVLGCAGMARVTRRIRAAVDRPVIDPVEAAAGAMRWLAAGPSWGRDDRP